VLLVSVLLSRRWVALHLLALVLVAACVALTRWQFDRAHGGNARSLGYAFQWPAFAIFTVGVWIWLCRDATRSDAGARPEPPPMPGRVPDEVVLPPLRLTRPAPADPDDPELTAYNRMLARLAEADDE
jgi:DNA-binding transcriptional regulator of glucitol operon